MLGRLCLRGKEPKTPGSENWRRRLFGKEPCRKRGGSSGAKGEGGNSSVYVLQEGTLSILTGGLRGLEERR